MRRIVIYTMLFAAIVLAACTQSNTAPSGTPSVPTAQQTPVADQGTYQGVTQGATQGTDQVVKTGMTQLGNIMTDANGMTLYVFLKDTNGTSQCYGACANFWPPLTVAAGMQPTGSGISASLGVTTRTDGTQQVTANGMPLYRFAKDKNPGDVYGQGSTGSGAPWYVLSPSGDQIRTSLQTGNGS